MCCPNQPKNKQQTNNTFLVNAWYNREYKAARTSYKHKPTSVNLKRYKLIVKILKDLFVKNKQEAFDQHGKEEPNRILGAGCKN